MAIALFSFNANANEIKENTIAKIDKIENSSNSEDLTTPRPRLTIEVDFGRRSRGCTGFGVCSVVITLELNFFLATTNERGNLVLEANARGLEAVRSHFGSNTITVEEDYKLSADVTKQLGLPSDYTIRAGRYTLAADGNGNYVTTM
ncbi:hypothetical protein D3C86_1421550 [compost metagenome]